MTLLNNTQPFPCASYIREIGRGSRSGRDLSRQDAKILYGAILAGRVSDLELGAILIAYRIKSESVQELAGMMDAVQDAVQMLDWNVTTPVVIPSYNGARKRPNLVPLLAAMLAQRGVPVLIHGVLSDPGRITTAEILSLMGIAAARDHLAIKHGLDQDRLAFAPIETLAPALASQLSLRATLGVRNSAHTLAKMLQPFRSPALRLVNYTHAAYGDTLSEYFRLPDTAGHAGVLLSRGTEGEAAADATLPREAVWLHDGGTEILIPATEKDLRDSPLLPESVSAAETAIWTTRVLAGQLEAPKAIAAQVDAIVKLCERTSRTTPG
ncbi:DNA-binding protein YbiB [Candidimonas sp. SYP-B2681]|uniref:DNA-binding protein YbiB n=1 Tax=Candidimonas sp. SYP-B2681 TaxID=2497686 RepID=UPI000F8849DA|nr:DNA-binding protein YbiB [Candidimonas sp. SYP-B2681]RTZ48206.1 DNA-binding protein YbiB [Candidimonas sp. SYP-B2681]